MVVTRLPPGAVCHVAYVDVRANPNPNELARKAADEIARDFKCGKDEVKNRRRTRPRDRAGKALRLFRWTASAPQTGRNSLTGAGPRSLLPSRLFHAGGDVCPNIPREK